MEALPEAISWCEIDQWYERPGAGRICMNMAMVDISHIPHVERGTVATLLGRDGNEEGLRGSVERVDGDMNR